MPATTAFSNGPRDRRIGHAGNDHLAAHFAEDRAANAEPWRSVFAEQTEALNIFHQRGPTWRRLGSHFRVAGLLEQIVRLGLIRWE
jgi:hypothetical protein